ncbi:hypothetical protein [Phaeacidiphilus oryzae]|uniref:hypothetical protein n=1 Tax=Phaeacidiphilus oryzae TaxID=348818 RepID=UPI000A96F326|nr:hypothetical protein [Phaeacidiphilus oryzae]
MLIVQGSPTTAVVRSHSGESVLLLSGEMPAVLTDEAVQELLDLAAAVLDGDECALFQRCLEALRSNTAPGRAVEIEGAVLTVFE